MVNDPYLIIDFDSTFITLESLDELARLALADSPRQAEVLEQLSKVTDLGMTGKIGFAESLRLRLEMFQANREHIQQLVSLLSNNVTPSVAKNEQFFRQQADNIYIISGGFIDYIWPVVRDFGLREDHVLANRFEFNTEGKITGCDQSCLLGRDNGKAQQVAALELEGPVYVIGDGYTDYQIKASGQADKFLAFTENIYRSDVVGHADSVLASFDLSWCG